MKLALTTFALLCVSTMSSAQAPRITPAGDPSVRDDSIYALAVDPAAHPEETAVLLLDDGVIRLDADGRGTTTYRMVTQILRADDLDDYREMRFTWAPQHQRFTLNWVKVVRPDGTIISSEPSHRQESDVPATMGDPIYSDTRVLRISLTGVEVGTIVDYSYTVEELKPFLEGDDFHSWSISTGQTVRRSRYIVDLPASVTPRIEERNLRHPRVERRAGGRRVYMWAANDVPRIKGERFAADSNGVSQRVQWALPMTWARIGAWYAGHARGRYEATPAVQTKLSELVAGARTLTDSIRAVHKFVAQDVRYVSIALGLGGYQPRTPDEVLRTGYGDCKDKATIFVAMMERMGLEARPVLLHSSGGVEESLPSIAQFDHVIAAYRRKGTREWQYSDLTALYTPLGELPFGPQGEFGVIVHPDGKTEEITLPLSEIPENRRVSRFRGEVGPDGLVRGAFEEVSTGILQYQSREALAAPFDSVQRVRTQDALASMWFQGGKGRNLEVFDGKDLTARVRFAVEVEGGQAVTSTGRSALLRLPIDNMARIGDVVRELEQADPRQYPISAQSVFGYAETVQEIELVLPEGWEADLPANVEVESPFGVYRKTYSQTDRTLKVTRLVAGRTGVHPPEKITELIEFLRSLGADDASVIVITK